MSQPEPGLVPVYIGQPERSDTERDRRLQRVPDGLDWHQHGLQPRWLGMETSDCAAALEPGFYATRGASETERFLTGARQRGEVALAVAVIGDTNDGSSGSVLSRYDSSVQLSDMFTSVSGQRLPVGTRPGLAPGLGAADRDLALRLLTRPPGAPWWSLHLSGSHMVRGDGSGAEHHPAKGQLQPVLIDALGDPVAAAWVPPAGDQRWYVIPAGTGWGSILDWLVQQALPEYVPQALRRARSPHFIDPDLQTTGELEARRALGELDARYAQERLRLEQALRDAETHAGPVRYGLLYGTGAELVQAVAQVLAAAGLRTVDLDEELGGTRSADLLVSAGGPPWRLVEVKSASGAAPEHLVSHLERHLATWPQLRPEPVTGGVLVVNHQHRLHPSQRAAQVYSRPEFIAALPVTVLSTLQLFHWWRTADWPAVRTAMLGADPPQAATAQTHVEVPPGPAMPPTRRRRWRPARSARPPAPPGTGQ